VKENLGAFYDKTSDFQQAQFDYFCSLIEQVFDAGKINKLLDIGSGTGKRTKQCFDIFPELERITAIEPDKDMYDFALERHDDPRIHYYRLAAKDLSQLDQSFFDGILSHWSVHWIPDKEMMMRDLNQFTSKGCPLMFSTCERLPSILEDIDLYIRSELGITKTGPSPFFYLTKEEWAELLKRHGWRILREEAFTVDHEAKDAKTYLEHWFSTSTGRFLYGKHMVEINQLALSDLIWFMERKYGSNQTQGGLEFTEDVYFLIAEKE
jgi:ubiquinone/menaquinone biosynthesis C-methylase UbiE